MKKLSFIILVFVFSCKKNTDCFHRDNVLINESGQPVSILFYFNGDTLRKNIALNDTLVPPIYQGDGLISLSDSAYIFFNQRKKQFHTKYSGYDCGSSLMGRNIFCPNQYTPQSVEECYAIDMYTITSDDYAIADTIL